MRLKTLSFEYPTAPILRAKTKYQKPTFVDVLYREDSSLPDTQVSTSMKVGFFFGPRERRILLTRSE